MMVSICCLSYNHKKYIREALDSILNQVVSFDYEIIIHDDCSTDGTIEIIQEYVKKYPKIIKPIFQNVNQHSIGKRIVFDYLLPAAHGKYIAFCECDDYWIDNKKLEKQVSFLENNPNCSLVFSATKILKNNGIFFDYFPSSKDSDFSAIDFIEHDGSFVPTATMMFRKKMVKDIPDYCYISPVSDWPFSIYLSTKGHAHYLADTTSVYRFDHPGSWTRTHKKNNAIKSFRTGMMDCLTEMMNCFSGKEAIAIEEKYKEQEFEYLVESGQLHELFKKYRWRIKKIDIKGKMRILYRFIFRKYKK